MCHTDPFTNYDGDPLNNLEDIMQKSLDHENMLIYIYF